MCPGVGSVGSSPALFTLSIPNDPSLIGELVFAQGLLFDPTPGATYLWKATRAAELRIGP